MSAPVIWIVIPAFVAVFLAIIRRWKFVVLTLGVFFSLIFNVDF